MREPIGWFVRLILRDFPAIKLVANTFFRFAGLIITAEETRKKGNL